MHPPDAGKAAKRLLWGLVVAIVLLNLALFLLYT